MRRWSRRPCSPIATSPTASCPTRRSIWSTRRRRSCVPRSTRCRPSSTKRRAVSCSSRSSARRCARRTTTPRSSGSRSSKRSWPSCTSRATACARVAGGEGCRRQARALREQIEQTKIEIDRATQAADWAKAAELKYGRLAELERQLAREGAALGDEPADAQGRGRRGGHRRDRQPLDRHSGQQAARRRDAEAAQPRGGAASQG